MRRHGFALLYQYFARGEMDLGSSGELLQGFGMEVVGLERQIQRVTHRGRKQSVILFIAKLDDDAVTKTCLFVGN
jgi:hypothetical protein